MDAKETRGYLNNNPGNLDRSDTFTWDGEIRDIDDPVLTPFQFHELHYGRFCVFVDAIHGIRALAKNLEAYYDKLRLQSVAAIIGKWAPPTENFTTNYIISVCETLRVTPNDRIDLKVRNTIRELVKAIIRVECWGQPYDDATIDAGLTAAGIPA